MNRKTITLAAAGIAAVTGALRRGGVALAHGFADVTVGVGQVSHVESSWRASGMT